MTSIIIQCAGSKNRAGSLRMPDGRPVQFCADPTKAGTGGGVWAAPWDAAPAELGGGSWLDVLKRYNEKYRATGDNPYELVPALDLYRPRSYGDLKAWEAGCGRFHGPGSRGAAEESRRVFILSAGWGLVRGDYLLPDYDVTFSSAADRSKRRGRQPGAGWGERQFTDDGGETHAFVGAAYREALFALAGGVRNGFLHHCGAAPRVPSGWTSVAWTGPARTNWQYAAIQAFL